MSIDSAGTIIDETELLELGKSYIQFKEFSRMATQNLFTDRHKFKDDVWGQILLNDLERDVIDTPEFQRLFRTSQMGFVDLVYQRQITHVVPTR